MSSIMTQQFLNNFNRQMTLVDGGFLVGSTGAVTASSVLGNGLATNGVVRLGVGTYQVLLSQPYNYMFGAWMIPKDAPSGSALSSPYTVGNTVTILALGTTTTAQWHTFGVPANIVPAVGVAFVVANTTKPGSGTVQALVPSGITNIEVAGLASATIGSSTAPCFTFTCFANGTATDPAAGTSFHFAALFRNSSVAY